MPRVIFSKWTFVVLVIFIAVSSFTLLAKDSPKSKKELVKKGVTLIPFEDIPCKYQILGRLGKPLGKLITVRGKWVDPGQRKDWYLIFHVYEVDGKPLQQNVEFPDQRVIGIFNATRERGGRGPMRGESFDWKFTGSGDVAPPKPAANELWEMTCVEIGDFKDYSDDAIKAMELSGQARDGVFGNYTNLEFVTIKKLK